MKRKFIIPVLIAVLLLAGWLYFRPLSMTAITGNAGTMIVTYTAMGIENGEPFMDMEKFGETTETQTAQIVALLEKYPYRRTAGTLFSDGTLNDIGQTVTIYLIEGQQFTDSIHIADTHKCIVNGKVHHLENSPELIDALLDIVAIK